MVSKWEDPLRFCVNISVCSVHAMSISLELFPTVFLEDLKKFHSALSHLLSFFQTPPGIFFFFPTQHKFLERRFSNKPLVGTKNRVISHENNELFNGKLQASASFNQATSLVSPFQSELVVRFRKKRHFFGKQGITFSGKVVALCSLRQSLGN